MQRLILALLGLTLLAGCGGAPATVVAPVVYDDDLYAASWCEDPDGYRMLDEYCPIGDGGDNEGFRWVYAEYRRDMQVVVVPMVGYRPPPTIIVLRERPARVSTLHIDRGSFPTVGAGPVATVDTAPVRTVRNASSSAGQRTTVAPAAAASSPGAGPTRNPDVVRGGLGAKDVKAKPLPPAPKARKVIARPPPKPRK